jgi:uncharacterized membrane protein
VHQLMSGLLGDETPLTFATMSAGWTGGTQNFVAVKEALSVTDAAMTCTLLMGALCYSVWLVSHRGEAAQRAIRRVSSR